MHKSFQYAPESTSTNEFPNETESVRLPLQESSTPSRGHRLPFDRSCQARSPPNVFLPRSKCFSQSPATEGRRRPISLRPWLRAAATPLHRYITALRRNRYSPTFLSETSPNCPLSYFLLTLSCSVPNVTTPST